MSLPDGEAHHWWTTIRRGTVFKRKYMGEQYMDARKREFLDLIQGYLSVANYKVGFLQLSQYAPKMILPERDCCKWFYFGINHEIRVYLVSQPIEVFDELVERARAVEETLAEPPRSMVTNSGKRASDSASGRSSKRGCDSHVSGSVARRGTRLSSFGWPLCVHCERRHSGECRKLTGGCFKCGSKEHFLRDCPLRVEVSET
ncbi:hypothetical protein V6Z11_A12G094700 [Gossypium hirsutum]